MSISTVARNPQTIHLADDTQLPDTDGSFVKNFQEHPQSLLLTDSIEPVLRRIYPDGQFCIGQDCGIYWREAVPPERGAEAPDWFLVPGVPPTLGGRLRRSYVMWREWLPPLIALEFVSGDGSDERDRTPVTGKFWVYENAIRPGYYGIYEAVPGRFELFQHVRDRFQPVPTNDRGHYPVPELGVELGLWRGRFLSAELPWLRWFDAGGDLLQTGREVADRQREEAERERQRAERLAAQLRALGVEPEA